LEWRGATLIGQIESQSRDRRWYRASKETEWNAWPAAVLQNGGDRRGDFFRRKIKIMRSGKPIGI